MNYKVSAKSVPVLNKNNSENILGIEILYGKMQHVVTTLDLLYVSLLGSYELRLGRLSYWTW